MAWGKVLKVSIGDPADPFRAEFDATGLPDLSPTSLTEADNVTDEGTAMDFTGLVTGFRITRSNKFNDNKAELNIANVSPETARRFISAEQSYITIEAGYEDEGTAMIFSGYVTSAISVWEGADQYMNIVAKTIRAKGYSSAENKEEVKIDGRKRKVGLSLEVVLGRERTRILSNTYMSMSYAPGAKVLDIARALSDNLGIVLNVFNESEVQGFTRPNGYNYVGRVNGVIDDLRAFLMAEGYDMTVALDEMNIYKINGEASVLDIPAISYDSGLLKVGPVQNYETDQHQLEAFPPKQVWEIETILIPRLSVNGIVEIRSDQLDGFYLVETIQFHGDNEAGDFNCTTVVSKQ